MKLFLVTRRFTHDETTIVQASTPSAAIDGKQTVLGAVPASKVEAQVIDCTEYVPREGSK